MEYGHEFIHSTKLCPRLPVCRDCSRSEDATEKKADSAPMGAAVSWGETTAKYIKVTNMWEGHKGQEPVKLLGWRVIRRCELGFTPTPYWEAEAPILWPFDVKS